MTKMQKCTERSLYTVFKMTTFVSNFAITSYHRKISKVYFIVFIDHNCHIYSPLWAFFVALLSHNMYVNFCHKMITSKTKSSVYLSPKLF